MSESCGKRKILKSALKKLRWTVIEHGNVEFGLSFSDILNTTVCCFAVAPIRKSL